MPRRIAESTLNASTVDILNVIRQNASYNYQQNVPVISQASQIPKVGEVLYGHPALANEFINALVNRIALVTVTSAIFNNPYRELKKGELAYGETIEEIFVNIAKVVDYNADDAVNREFRRTYPDVRSAFHAINWRVMYPLTIQQEELARAFLSEEGVRSLIDDMIGSIYTAAEYDEFLLFKYLIIKGCTSGMMHPIGLANGASTADAAVAFRAISNKLPFMNSTYNLAGVKTATPKDRQVIFMDADFNAAFDVNVLAGAFNMDKADFIGRLHLIDSFATFDNDRFAVIRANSDGLEEVTATELGLMGDVVAVICDERWFQVYDNLTRMTETPVNSGLYWNYFFHTWKTISSSPFANAVAITKYGATITAPASITATIASKDVNAEGIVLTLSVAASNTLQDYDYQFVQTSALTTAGIAIDPAGGVIIPISEDDTSITLVANMAGTVYTASSTITGASADVGDTVTLAIAS